MHDYSTSRRIRQHAGDVLDQFKGQKSLVHAIMIGASVMQSTVTLATALVDTCMQHVLSNPLDDSMNKAACPREYIHAEFIVQMYMRDFMCVIRLLRPSHPKWF